jgi:hypothetical protein
MHVKKQESYFICRYHEDTVRLPHHSILQCAPRGHAVDDIDLPSLVDQDELSISTAGYEKSFLFMTPFLIWCIKVYQLHNMIRKMLLV